MKVKQMSLLKQFYQYKRQNKDMNDPLIGVGNKQSFRFEEVNQLFDRVFDPQNFSISKGIREIKQFGGITSVTSLLQTSHRQGLSSFADNNYRIQVFGENTSPKRENIIRKAISNERDFTINLLLYIITLRFFIKLLFMRDGIVVQSIWDEIVSFTLLLVMISLKAMVNLEFFKLDQNEKKYHDDNWIKVRRDGEIIQTMEKCLMVGDIAIFSADDHIRIDGVIMACNDFYVSQSQTIVKQQSKKKNSILNMKENENNQNFDPFVFSGSTVLYGTAQVLICRIGESCSFRLKEEKFSPFSTQVTPLIHNLKKVLNYVQKMSNIVAFIASGFFGLYFLHEGIVNKTLSWLTFLQILKKFSSLIGFVCLLQKLKIVRSLQFYLQSFRSDKCFRIKNKRTLEKLNQVDLFIIQKQAIRIHHTQRGYIVPKINFLSFLNNNFKLKIVTKQTKQKTMQEFDYFRDTEEYESDRTFYEEPSNETSEQRLLRLRQCLFIPDCTRKKLQTQLLPIFEGLQYRIVYIYKHKPNEEYRPSRNVISIAFAQQTIEGSRGVADSRGGQEWVRIKNTMVAEQEIKQIMVKSIRFSQLYNIYMMQFLNNIVIFIFLSWISIYRTYSIDFYWSLTIIIIARFIFFRIYRMIALDNSEPQYETRSHRRIIKLNIYLFFYYLYVLNNIEEKINVVLFFVCNTMLRTEIMLIKVERDISIRNIVKNNLVVFAMLGCYLIFRMLNHLPVHQQLMLVQYVMGLSLLLVVYGFVH